jgi:NADH:ubiquinone oxidoreductase subunit 3 (subunit A)
VNPFFINYFPIFVGFIVSIILSVIIFGLSFLLSFQRPDAEKLSAYECGFDPYEDARNTFDIKFYLIAIIFVIFDLETMFLFPWGISTGSLNSTGFWVMIDFLFELIIGYIYIWKIGAIDW